MRPTWLDWFVLAFLVSGAIGSYAYLWRLRQQDRNTPENGGEHHG